MNILVIGGTRFMGKHLVETLLCDGHTVTIATRGIADDSFGGKVKRIIFDRTDENSIKKAFTGQNYDIVYDQIAYCAKDIDILLKHLPSDRYIQLSTTAVYHKTYNTCEHDFDPLAEPAIMCSRGEFSYADSKRHAERLLAQKYASLNSVSVRFPFVIGIDDYTNRLSFYVEHIIKQIPMYVDNFDSQMAFVRSDEAGRFLAHFATHPFIGKINGASDGTSSIGDIAKYIKQKTGLSPILSENGNPAPYNGEAPYWINTSLAKSIGFSFTPLHEWVYDLIDFYLVKFLKESL